MAVQNALINNVLLLLSPLRDLGGNFKITEDHVIITPIGCFRIAYSAKDNVSALFYARHADDLSAVIDGQNMDIAHKERIYLIEARKAYNDQDAVFDPADPRQQLDLSWVGSAVTRVMHDLPRILMREATLHRLSDTALSSGFMSYQASQVAAGDDLYNIDIGRKPDSSFQLADVSKANGLSAFQRASRKMLARLMPHLRLKVSQQIDGQTILKDTFALTELPAAILADFHLRLNDIWDRVDPIHWRENKLVPLFRVVDSVQSAIERLPRSKEDLAREGAAAMTHVLLDGPVSYLTSTAIDVVSGVGETRFKADMPRGWEKLVDYGKTNLRTIQSHLHKILLRTHPDQFKDLRWLDPKLHKPSFHSGSAKADAHDVFQSWLGSLFLAPYATTIEYIGADAQIANPQTNLKDTVLIRLNVSNGVVLLYVVQDKKLFGYYSKPDFVVHQRELPAGAENYFSEHMAVELKLGDPEAAVRAVPFSHIQKSVSGLLPNGTLNLLPPESPAIRQPSVPPASSGQAVTGSLTST